MRLSNYVRIGMAIWVCGAAVLRAAEPNPQADEPSPAFHRIFLPPEEIDRRTWKQRYLPVDAKEFEQALAIIAGGAVGSPDARSVQLVEAHYTAQLLGDDLLIGTARFRLRERGSQPALLTLEPCSLAIESAVWPATETDDGAVPEKAAVLGTDARGRLQVLVEGSRLECRWSLRGQRTASGAVRFAVDVPRVAVSLFELSAPTGSEVHDDQGLLLAETQSSSTDRWSMALGGNNRLALKIVPREASGNRRPLTLLRQATTYEFTSRGINVGAQLRLDVHGEPLSRLSIDLDDGLHLIGAKFGDRDLPWSATSDLETGRTRVLLEFEQALSGTGRIVQISAVAPLVTDQKVQLPALRPQGVAWQEGTANLILPNALSLEQLLTSGCRQSRVTALPAPLAGESVEVQFFEPGGRIELRLAEPRQKISVTRGAQIEIGPGEITARETYEVKLPGEDSRLLRIPIQTGWIVDSVETSAAGEVLAWDIDESAETNAQLQIKLDTSTQLAVRGHRERTSADALQGTQLRMLDLAPLEVRANLVSVSAAEGMELQLSTPDALEPRDLAALPAAEQSLFQSPLKAPIYNDDDRFGRASVSTSRRKPAFAADLSIDVVAQNRSLTETFTILCTPATARVDRLLVHLSQGREQPPQWSLAGGNSSGQFSARKLSAGEQEKAGLRSGGEVWELLLQISRPGPFELRGQRTLPFTAETPLSLAAVSEADSQRGTLAIRALGDTGLEINNRGLMSVPAELLDQDRYQTARAAFHFQPAGGGLNDAVAVSIAPAPASQAATGCWAWRARLVSRLAPDGLGIHETSLELQTAGRQTIAFTLPPDATLLSARIDGVEVPAASLAQTEEKVQLKLAPGRRRASLQLTYSLPSQLPSIAGWQTAPFPEFDLPVLERWWTVWMPPDFRASEARSATTVNALAPPTWSQRLFGILGRGPGQHTFNPLVASDWQEIFAGRSPGEAAQAAGRQLLVNLAAIAQQHLDDEVLTWGQLLAAAQEAAPEGLPVLIDAESLSALGLHWQSRIADLSAPLSGSDLLDQAQLRLIATTTGYLVITSSAAAAGYEGLQYSDERALAVADEQTALCQRLRAATPPQLAAIFPTIDIWRELSDESEVSSEPTASHPAVALPTGWRSYEMRCASGSPASICIAHHWRMRSLSWAALLAVIALCLWKPLNKLWLLVAFVGAASGMALVLPGALAPLASAAVLGGLFGIAVRLFQQPSPRSAPPAPVAPTVRPSSSIVRATGVVLAFASLVAGSGVLDAAQLPPSAAPATTAAPATSAAPAKSSAAPLYSVLVPFDQQAGQPAGDKLYVPDTLYEQLLRKAAAISGRPQEWLVQRGGYEGAIARDPVTMQPRLTRMRARFDLHVFQSNVQVTLPLQRDAWREVLVEARLDGRAIQPQWSSEGDLLQLGSLSPGAHRLELELKPALVTEPKRAGFDLRIPPLAQSTLTLLLPADLTGVEVPTALGRVNLEAGRGELKAQLGAADRLAVRWPASDDQDSAAPNLEVEELVWIKVRPGTTVLDARFKFQVLSGRVRTLRLLTDPRLRLLTTPPAESGIAAVHTIPGEPQLIELELAAPVSGQFNVELSFLVSDASGVGNLRLPRLEAADARAIRRWLGVTVDPALQFRVQAGEDSRTVDAGEFLAAWGIGESKPLRAYGIPRGEPIWFLATQPGEPQVQANQVTAVSLSRQLAELRWDATIEITAGVLAQLVLQGPSGLEIERVSVREQDVERVARWATDNNGRISVFLSAPIEGRHQVALRGRWKLAGEPVELPGIKLQGATVSRSQWEIYRQPSVLVTVTPPTSAKPFELPASARRTGFGSLCGCYLNDDESSAIRAMIVPNDPRISGQAATFIEHVGENWFAEVRSLFVVDNGLIDNLQFEIPPQWSEPFRVEPAGAITVSAIPGQAARQLTYAPASPLSGKHAVTIRGRIAPSPGDRLSVPDVVPLRINELERFVVLPKTLESQQVTWDTLRLVPAKLPPELLPRDFRSADSLALAVAGERFQASLKSVRRDRASALVRLADIHLSWLPEGGFTAVATLGVEPGGISECQLLLPEGCELIHATVEQLPASLSPISPGKFKLELGSAQLPQRIELVYAQRTASPGSRFEYQPPRLADVKVEHTLWTIYPLPGVRGAAEDVSLRVSATDQQLARMAGTVQLVELPSEVFAEHLPEEIARWFDAWRARYVTDRTKLHRELILGGRHVFQSEEGVEARALDRKMTAASERMTPARSGQRQTGAVDLSTDLVDRETARAASEHYQVRGGQGGLTVRYSATASSWPMARWLAALTLVPLAGCLSWWLRGIDPVAVSPWAVVSAIAAFCWLLLAPSFLGLLLLVALLIAALGVNSTATGRPRS